MYKKFPLLQISGGDGLLFRLKIQQKKKYNDVNHLTMPTIKWRGEHLTLNSGNILLCRVEKPVADDACEKRISFNSQH